MQRFSVVQSIQYYEKEILTEEHPKLSNILQKRIPTEWGRWSNESLTHVSTMVDSDFRHNEKSVTIEGKSVGNASVCFFDTDSRKITLADTIPLDLGAVVDTTYMNVNALQNFYRAEIADAKKRGILFSLHLKGR